jgi:hypothetical protein
VRTVSDKVKSRGHWLTRVYPELYPPKTALLQLGALERAVSTCSVSFRGWDFPHYSTREQPMRTRDFVEQSLDWEHFVELWRAYRSGQFVSLAAIPGDWRDQSTLWPPQAGWATGTTFSVEDAVFTLVEVYEFGARWVEAVQLQGPIVIECNLRGIQNRSLELDKRKSGFSMPKVSQVPEWTFRQVYEVPDLLAHARELATEPAIGLFELFGWDTTVALIDGIQKELGP